MYLKSLDSHTDNYQFKHKWYIRHKPALDKGFDGKSFTKNSCGKPQNNYSLFWAENQCFGIHRPHEKNCIWGSVFQFFQCGCS